MALGMTGQTQNVASGLACSFGLSCGSGVNLWLDLLHPCVGRRGRFAGMVPEAEPQLLLPASPRSRTSTDRKMVADRAACSPRFLGKVSVCVLDHPLAAGWVCLHIIGKGC